MVVESSRVVGDVGRRSTSVYELPFKMWIVPQRKKPREGREETFKGITFSTSGKVGHNTR